MNAMTMTKTVDGPMTAAYLARRGASSQWRGFLRALVETLDEHLDTDGRASLMRAVGTRMAGANPLPHCDRLDEMEARINDLLAAADWGYVQIAVDSGSRRMVVTHYAAPAIAAGADVDGRWIAPVLEGMYSAWFGAQPGADAALRPVVTSYAPGSITLHYGRGE